MTPRSSPKRTTPAAGRSRGIDMLDGARNYLDLVPKGRDEDGLKCPMDAGTTSIQSNQQPKENRTMTTHQTGTREDWLGVRLELLQAEKALTRRSDELARQRQALPWVRIDKDYRFETDEGSASLADLFKGRSQLLVYHFMFGLDYTAGCPSCSSIADGFNGIAIHLAHHDVMLMAVSRAPLEKLQTYKRRMGWTFPWASSASSDFNFDFSVGMTEEQQRKGGIEYNYRREAPLQWRGGEDAPVA